MAGPNVTPICQRRVAGRIIYAGFVCSIRSGKKDKGPTLEDVSGGLGVLILRSGFFFAVPVRGVQGLEHESAEAER